MPDLDHICHCVVITVIARLARHRCKSVRQAVSEVLHSASREWGICSEVFLPSPALSSVSGPRWEDRVVRALASLGVGLLASSIAPCPDAWRPQVQLAGNSWTHQTGVLRGTAVCILAGPADPQDVGHLPDTSHQVHPELALAAASCFMQCGHVPVEAVDLLSTPAWVAGMTSASGHSGEAPRPDRLVHPLRKKLHSHTKTTFSSSGDELVVGGYRLAGWQGLTPTTVPLFHIPAPLAFAIEDVYCQYQRISVCEESFGLTSHHQSLEVTPDAYLFMALSVPQLREHQDRILSQGLVHWAVLLQVPGLEPTPATPWEPLLEVRNIPPDKHMVIVPRGTRMVRGSMFVWQSEAGPPWTAEIVTAINGWAELERDPVRVEWNSLHPRYRPSLVTATTIDDLPLHHDDVAEFSSDTKLVWLSPTQYYWVPAGASLTSSDASGGKQGSRPGTVSLAISNAGGISCSGSFYGTVPEAECVATAGTLRHGPVDVLRAHVVDATVIASVHRRVSADRVGGVPLHSSRLVNQVAVDFMQEALSHRGEHATEWAYVIRQSSHLASVILHRSDQAAESAGRPVHLRPPGTHVQLIQPQED